MGTLNIPDAHRCRYQAKTSTGRTIECNDLGGWVLDVERKTWRPAKPGERKRRCWLHGPASSTKPVGRNRKPDKPNERLQRYASLVLGLSPEAAMALREVDEELSMLGFPSAGGNGGGSSGSDDGPVARDAIRIAELTELRNDLRARISDDYIDEWLTDLIRTITRIRRRPPAARGARLCKDNQQDRDGSVEWGDATCTELPVRDGLCSSDWQRERRWLQANGKPTLEKPSETIPRT